jgi:ABC-type nitrate/sulfonate/bicarbonate transport system substrate-binding protein
MLSSYSPRTLTTLGVFISINVFVSAVSLPSVTYAQGKKLYFCQVTRSVNLMAPFVAQKKGFFKKEGIDVELIQALGNICIAGLISNSIDYTNTFGSVVRVAIKGAPIRVVMGTHDGADHALIVRQGIDSFKDLRGKAMGVSRGGGGADVIARLILEKHGLIPDKDVKISTLGSMEARVAALEQGLVAAASVSMVSAFPLQQKGFKVLAWAFDELDFPFNCVCTTVEKIKKEPDEIKKVLRGFFRAVEFMQKEREQTISLMMEWSRIDRETAEKAYEITVRGFSKTGEPKPDAIRVVLEQAKKEMKLADEIPVSRVADFSLLREVQKELGIRR